MKNLTKAEIGLLTKIATHRPVRSIYSKTNAPLALSLSRAGYLIVTSSGYSLTETAKRHLVMLGIGYGEGFVG